MKQSSLFKLFSLFIFISSFCLYPQDGHAVSAHINSMESECILTQYAPLSVTQLAGLSRKEVEHNLQRKFSISERYEFYTVKRSIKRATKDKKDLTDCEIIQKKSSHSIVFGVVGLFLIGIILGIFAINTARKAIKLLAKNPDCPDAEKHRKKAKLGIVLGVIDIIGALIVIVLLRS